MNLWKMLCLATLTALLLAQSGAAETAVNDAALGKEADGSNWLSYGRTYSEQRFSPLDQVNRETVKRLGLSWFLELPEDRSLIGTPLAVDGVLYFTGSYSKTRAVDAKTGKLLWEYDPKTIEHLGDKMRLGWDSSRGLAFWNGKVVIATLDGRLVGIDAKTGKRVWETQTIDPEKAYYITGTPKVFRGLAIVGNGGTEHTAARGYVSAYNADTGEFSWRFHIVPGNPADGFENAAMEMAAKTWTGEWWNFGGGGNVWNGISYDPDFDQVIIGTGNGSPWNRKIRSPGGGDNLFLCSLLALDATTGEYKWHYQTVPGETWDYNSNMDIVLADLPIDGKQRKVLLHAPKNGFFYVVDRKDGKLLSAEKIGKVTWASHIDMETGRPVEIEGARYEDGAELVWPSPFGVHNWHAMSFNPRTGLAYIPTIELPALFTDEGIDLKSWRSPNFVLSAGVEFGGDTDPDVGSASLLAWDPVQQKEAFRIPLPSHWNPGTMTTAGDLVFQGRATGDFKAYDAKTGEELWSQFLGLGISAPPITYEIEGTQYVSILVGWGGSGLLLGSSAAQYGWAYRAQPRRLYTFALDGKTPMPASPGPVIPKPVDVADFAIDGDLVKHGQRVYNGSCMTCHGGGAVSGGYAPDLRASLLSTTRESFAEVVKTGRMPLGMPRYQHFDAKDIDGLFHFIRERARETANAM